MKKNIIVFSNPFGYGPTGTAIPVMISLLKKMKDSEIVFAGSGLCMEIMSDIDVKKVYLNERNEEEIAEYLSTVENPYVIGSQNRFCIKAAKKLNIPCAFIDILAWFWKEIPLDHFLADEIFWIKFPGVKDKIPQDKKNIHLVSSIIRTPTKENSDNRRYLTIHIGGAKYPPLNEVPCFYLNLLAKGLNELKIDGIFTDILFAGGSEATDYLKGRLTNKKVHFIKEDYIKRISQSSHLLTSAGVSSTLEAFSLNVPTSFLLPLNLSQVALLDILLKNNCAPNYMIWNDYVNESKDLRNMIEKDAITEINNYAKMVDQDIKLSSKFVKNFINLATLIPNNSKQIKLIEYLGDSGADEIVDILSEKWDLLPRGN
jgi:hypothetical protein